jgi:hypothetical protein
VYNTIATEEEVMTDYLPFVAAAVVVAQASRQPLAFAQNLIVQVLCAIRRIVR